MQGQNPYLWFLKHDADYSTDAPLFYEETALLKYIDALRGFQEDFVREPADAYIADYVPGSGFALVAEEKGNRLNREKTIEAIKAANFSIFELQGTNQYSLVLLSLKAK